MKKYIILLYLISYGISFVSYILTKEYDGDFRGEKVTVDNLILSLSYILVCIQYIGAYWIYNILYYFRIKKKNITLFIARERYETILFILILFNYIFYAYTGVGKAGGFQVNKYSFLITRIPLNIGIYIYILSYIERSNKRYFLLIFLFLFLQIFMGWTGNLFIVLILYFGKKYKEINIKIIIFFIFTVLMYPFIYMLKFFIRGEKNIQLEYFKYLGRLFERFSNFSVFIKIIELKDNYIVYINNYIKEYSAIKEMFIPIIPAKRLGIDLDLHLLTASIRSNYKILMTSSMDVEFFSKVYIYFKKSNLEGIAFIIASIFLVFILIIVLGGKYGKKYDILMFVIFINYIRTGKITALALDIYGLIFWYILIKYFLLKKGRR